MSLDADPDSGEMEEKSYFLDVTSYFLYDESLKANFSIGVNQYQYDEENSEGIGFLPLIDFSDPDTTTPITLYQDLTFSKINASLLKTFQLNKHTLLTGVHFFSKKYDTTTFSATNSLNQEMDLSINDFDKENTYSFLLQDDYKVFDNLTLLANFKIDKYIREGSLKNSTERLFRVGAIYTPYENLGFKTFFTKTYLPVSFYNVDFENIAAPELNSQQYQFYTAEMAYTYKKSKLNIIYNYTTIDDFIYLTQQGFINVDERIKTQGVSFSYTYNFSPSDKFYLNYYFSTQNQNASNYQKGGYVKYMGSFKKIDYFGSLIYKDSFTYDDLYIKDSFDLSLGATYNFTKDFSVSLKGKNLLKKSTQSIYQESFSSPPILIANEPERVVGVSFKWIF
jgi:iron complex outermembrane receptor protein